MLDVRQELAKSGMTLVVVTHELGFACKAADEVIFLDVGAIVERITPDGFFLNPGEERSCLFLSQILR